LSVFEAVLLPEAEKARELLDPVDVLMSIASSACWSSTHGPTTRQR